MVHKEQSALENGGRKVAVRCVASRIEFRGSKATFRLTENSLHSGVGGDYGLVVPSQIGHALNSPPLLFPTPETA